MTLTEYNTDYVVLIHHYEYYEPKFNLGRYSSLNFVWQIYFAQYDEWVL